MNQDLKNRFGLKSHYLEQLESFFQEISPLQKVIIFGSRAKGSSKYNSDIDLVYFGELSSIDLIHIQDFFDNSDIPFKVDFLNYNKITNSKLKDHIDRVGKVIYSN